MIITKEDKFGKILQIAITIQENKILNAKITGDFFLYPEEKITALEQAITGFSLGDEPTITKSKLTKQLTTASEHVTIVGFSIENLSQLICEAIND